jgi:hypothetical protein
MSSKFEEIWRGFKYLQMQISEWESQMNSENDPVTRRKGFEKLRLTLTQIVNEIERVEKEEE